MVHLEQPCASSERSLGSRQLHKKLRRRSSGFVRCIRFPRVLPESQLGATIHQSSVCPWAVSNRRRTAYGGPPLRVVAREGLARAKHLPHVSSLFVVLLARSASWTVFTTIQRHRKAKTFRLLIKIFAKCSRGPIMASV